ncbi:fumarylacetoacetate hydrolase family protein [Thermomicrobium roseum]|uniref:2-hydroxyhepta-2,4-diene-1,7-dioate isomerase n=1 Tax=Thermomicrobium roseum (strain ATCC 27502 / DSM 5159 / P-2) TaxID=309801 RepID=B9L3W1_THERP|nr:fumarylacetoacetate hydrolase family protein [Thermomicrobium roseum]ACM06990.1 2-hydroxyhepta-2,4-diene-1,7-dioate isomerase [Thermomicrobium roseum DSM 5159]
MRLVTYSERGRTSVGVLEAGWILDIPQAYTELLRQQGVADAAGRALAECPPDVVLLLARDGLGRAREAVAFAREALARDREGALQRGLAVAADAPGVRLRAPLQRPGKIICLGLNYADHARETNSPIPQYPELFNKFANALIGPGEPIVLPRVSQQVDYEAELAVVIGKPGRYIDEQRALEHVAGYTVLNDVSMRDFQFRGRQWMQGKTFDRSTPLGPWIVTAEEIPDPQALDISCEVSGEVLQRSNTREMIFSVAAVVAYISQIMTLEPGDLIATGTPAGVGFAREPKRLLQPGDVVRVTIERIGTLENPVIAEE